MSNNAFSTLYRAYMYVKMFLGMGFIWTFEIISHVDGNSVHEGAW